MNDSYKKIDLNPDCGLMLLPKHKHIDPLSFQKTGRNDPCPCGSLKKFKKCCLARMLKEESENRERLKAEAFAREEKWREEYYAEMAKRLGKSSHSDIIVVTETTGEIETLEEWKAKQPKLEIS